MYQEIALFSAKLRQKIIIATTFVRKYLPIMAKIPRSDSSTMKISDHTSATMPQTSTLQTVIEAVEALSPEDQDFLFDLIHKRRTQPSQAIRQRREEIRQNGIAVMEAVRNGTAKRGTVAELIADIFDDETD
jgi:hypothetical protein